MSAEVKVSVIIPTYGIPVYLGKSILSVLSQTLKDLELIIVDDNNPNTEAREQTEKLVNHYLKNDSRIHYVKHTYNMNGAVARNTGFDIAKGKYISLLDSDDEYMPTRLKMCYDVMESAPLSVGGVYTGCVFRHNGITYSKFKRVKSGKFLIQTLACSFRFCSGSNIFVRKTVVNELKGFDPLFHRHQDYEFLVRFFEHYSLVAIQEYLIIKNNENFNVPNLDKIVEIKKQYLTKYKYIIDSLPQSDVNKIMYSNFINIAENALDQKNTLVANEYYKKASQYGGLSFRDTLRRIIYPLYLRLRR